MKIDATQAELEAVAEVLKLAALLDVRIPAPEKPRIAAWAEQVHRHRLERGDLLDGVQAYYDNPSDRAIGIGELIQHARAIKRARLDKEADDVREERQEANDVKAADDVAEVAHLLISGPTGAAVKTKRLIAAENSLQCAVDKASAQEAIREYFAAKAEARKTAA